MASVIHPAYAEENVHLAGTQKIIAHERQVAFADRRAAEGSLSTARMYDPDALPLREMMYARAVQTEKNLASAAQKPYFTRINFTEKGGSSRIYYIGKYGVLRTDSLDVEVVDWRAPVANLYYSGQIGPLKYNAPDGEVEGELTLKRQFGMENGEITTIFDADIVSQDEYLQGVLAQTTGDRLKEIITTIQAEQNYVIRYPLDRNLVVQGVAGSGKTTIALHRIAYLLYTYQEKLRPENMLILAPNPLFLNFIAQVLPDLGVESVTQTTYQLFFDKRLDEFMPKYDDGDRLSDVLSMDAGALEKYTAALRAKGSLKFMVLMDSWLDAYEDGFPLTEDIMFGPVVIYSVEELRKVLLVDEKPFPLRRRLDELKKQLKRRVKGAVNQINEWYARECDKKIMELPKKYAEKADRTAAALKLQESLIKRQEETKKQGREFPKNAMKAFGELDPAKIYRQFLQDMLENCPDPEIRGAAEYTLSKIKYEREDIAPIALIAERVCELKRPDIRHIVIDEAQDFNAFEVELLRRVTRGATFTIVGDLMQGIAGYRGLENWEELTDGVFHGGCQRHELITSYRNTIEIMDFASRVVRNMPIQGLTPAKPVLRHGDKPIFMKGENADAVALAKEWREAGMKSVAIMARSRKRLSALSQETGWPVIDPESNEYPSGVVLAPADAVKGLEFDAVIVLDADRETYPARALDSRLLYVCLTRALHKMAVYYQGESTELLDT